MKQIKIFCRSSRCAWCPSELYVLFMNSRSRIFHIVAENDFATNGNDGMVMVSNTRWSVGMEWCLGYNDIRGHETETHIGRYIGKM